mmetsp:Transcript_18512/g.22790  ORF Transcript_18512/g.22790 Transcript_18512/m.22790 type:complete len:334 (-) Transcript_18512:116-1117(-)
MGKKLLLIGSGVALGATLGYIICLFLPFHKMYWKFVGFMDALHMTIYTTSVHYDWKMLKACKLVRTMTAKKDLCAKDENGESISMPVPLQDSSATFCSDAVQAAVRGACPAMSSAYIMGVLLILVIVANVIMQGVGLFLIKEYMKKPRKQYREVAFFLNLIGGILVLTLVILYYPTTILQLDSMTILMDAGGVVGLADSIGVSWGYVFMYFFIILQGVSICLHSNGSNSAEAREEELREQKKFLREQEMFHQVEMTGGPVGQPGAGVTAPPTHWGQGVQQSNWGAPQGPPQGYPSTNQAYPNYGYGGPPMPSMQPMPPHMSNVPPMQQPGAPR